MGTRAASRKRLVKLREGFPVREKGKVTVRKVKPDKRKEMSKADAETIQNRLGVEEAMGVKRGTKR